MTEKTVSVGDLVQFCHRSGDIDHRFSPSPTGVEGIAGHQRLYARRAQSYLSEYGVEYLHEVPGLVLTLRGRADGYDPQQGLVEEIKTCRIAPDTIPEPVAQLHLAQGKVYAAIIAAQDKLERLDVRVTWLNIDSDEEYSRTEQYSAAELAKFLRASLTEYTRWLQIVAHLQSKRDHSLATLDFPYGGFRDGQRGIAELAYKCIDQGGQLLLEAPTGIGKTAAVLFPALKALAIGKHDRMIFVTTKTVGRKAAQDTLAHFAAAGYRGSSLSLTAKEKICLSPGKACHGDDCPYASHYYDKLPQALDTAINQGALHREDIEELARRFEICPYELTQDLLPWVDVIIADTHYVYSLSAGLGSAMETGSERWTLLVDEAHNLPGRARSMYSARLGKTTVLAAKNTVSGALQKALTRINRQFLALQKASWQEADFHSSDTLPQALILALQVFTGEVSAQLAQEPAFLQRHPVLMDFYFEVLQFMRVAEQWGDEYRCQLSRDDSPQSLCITLNCLDPSRLLAQRQQRAHAVTAFSATLSPLPWSRSSLGLGDEAVCHRTRSPFEPAQLQVKLATHIDTRYRQREASLPALAQLIEQWLQQVAGNCIVYFPSYAYMRDCLARMALDADPMASRLVWQQHPQADDAQREALLELLAQQRNVAAFCILGGVFGEGIDLPGEQLSSVVVVGVGMPQVNRDTRQLQAWYGEQSGAGFEYAFLFPGMQKVDQALGRVVRSMTDRGAALLIDSRYREPAYRQLLPRWWHYEPWLSADDTRI